MNCKTCVSYDKDEGCCIFCKGYDPDMKVDDWDIFNLDENEWEHIQVQNRLHDKGIECLFVDMWTNDNIAWIFGANTTSERIALALNIREDSVYYDYEHGLVILNLFQEKYLRGMLND